jgi:hypothetical protein
VGRLGGCWGDREGVGESGRVLARQGGCWGDMEGVGETGRVLGRQGGCWGDRGRIEGRWEAVEVWRQGVSGHLHHKMLHERAITWQENILESGRR